MWKASDELLRRTVAIKECMLPPTVDDADREKMLTRVMREARTAARLDHPALVTVFDVVQESGRPWIVMEYVESRSLSQVVRQDGPMPVSQVVDIGITLLDALYVAHTAGVLHRDVKPANVLLTESGNVVLTDFGIAATTGDPTLTTSGMLLGSPSYMPPERARGEAATPDSDVWSLAATLYTLVEGTTPYSGDHPLAVLSAVVDHRRRPMENAGPLEPLLAEILDSEPEQRPGELSVRRRMDRIKGQLAAAHEPTTNGGTPIRTNASGEKSAAERTARLSARRPSRRQDHAAAPVVPVEGAGPDGRPGEQSAEALSSEALSAEALSSESLSSESSDFPDASAVAPPTPGPDKPERRPRWRRRRSGAGAAGAAGAASAEQGESWDFEGLLGGNDASAAPEKPSTVSPSTAATSPAEPAAPQAAAPSNAPTEPSEPEVAPAAPTIASPEPDIAEPAAEQRTAPDRAPQPAAAPRSPRPRSRRAPLLLGIGALVVVAVVTLALILAGGNDRPTAVPGVPAPSAGSSAGTSSGGSGSSPSSSASPSSGTGAAVPAGWQSYRDSTFGWSIAVPPEFTRSKGGTTNQTDFRDSTGRLLRVEIAPQAHASAIGDWRSYEPSFARTVSNYQRIRIEPADGGTGTRAADWEFTFNDGGSDLHVLNRGVVDGRTAHALYWQTPDSSWSGSTALRDQIFSTFQPPPQ